MELLDKKDKKDLKTGPIYLSKHAAMNTNNQEMDSGTAAECQVTRLIVPLRNCCGQLVSTWEQT